MRARDVVACTCGGCVCVVVVCMMHGDGQQAGGIP